MVTKYFVVKKEEGFRSKAYYCTEGYPTIGYGTKLSHIVNAPMKYYTGLTVTEEIAHLLMVQEMASVEAQLNELAWYTKLNLDRQAIIISMAYQMGVSGVLAFRKMIRAIEADDYYEAGREMKDSKWYRQTPNRAKRHISVMEAGKLSVAYREE